MLANLTLAQNDPFMSNFMIAVIVITAIILLGAAALLIRCWRKVAQGTAIVRNGMGGTYVNFSGMFIIPILHKAGGADAR